MTTKLCPVCKEVKLVTEFTKSTQRKSGYGTYCKPCDTKRKQAWVKANPKRNKEHMARGRANYRKNTCPKKLTALVKKHSHTKKLKRFGITQADFDMLLVKCENACSICKRPISKLGLRGLAIDHNHTTGKVRGLLCGDCNTGLGLLKDNITILKNSINYLEKHNNETD